MVKICKIYSLNLNMFIVLLVFSSLFVISTSAILETPNEIDDDNSNEDVEAFLENPSKKAIDKYRYLGGIGKRVINLDYPKTYENELMLPIYSGIEDEDEYLRQVIYKLLRKLRSQKNKALLNPEYYEQKLAYKNADEGYPKKKAIDPYRFMGNIGRK